MDRRALLTATGVTLTSAFAGCLVDGTNSVDTIAVSEPTVRPGETADISIEAPDLSGLRIGDFPEAFHPDGSLQLGEATFSPSPDLVWTVSPPHWGFSGRDTEGVVPIETSPETPPVSYRFGLDFYIDGEDEPRRVETTVTVASRSG